MKDRSGWLEFCVGRDEAQGNVSSFFDDGEDESILLWKQHLPTTGHSRVTRIESNAVGAGIIANKQLQPWFERKCLVTRIENKVSSTL